MTLSRSRLLIAGLAMTLSASATAPAFASEPAPSPAPTTQATPAQPGQLPKKPHGCLGYGLAGAVGGHFVGHHGILGAAAGCAYGWHKRHAWKKEQKALAAQKPN